MNGATVSEVQQIPRLTTLIGRLCAEKSKITFFRVSSGYVASVFSMFVAKASTRPWWTGQRSMTLHLIKPPELPASDTFRPSSRFLHFQSSFSELPVVEHEYCGYCVKATALPHLPPPNPSSSSFAYISSVRGSAYRKATYGLCGAVSGEIRSRILHISDDWNSDHFRIGEPPPIASYCFLIFGVLRRDIRGPRYPCSRPRGIKSPSACVGC